MLIPLFRTLILYFCIILAVRLMGKRQVGELEPSELVLSLIIADLAAVPMQDYGIPLFTGLIPIITLLRNAALNSLQYQRELQAVRNQQLDIRQFEENMAAFKEGFARNYRLASERFRKAIEEIDKTIDHLQKTKDALLSSENNLRLANNKAEELSIKKLTKNAPSVRAMFEEQCED